MRAPTIDISIFRSKSIFDAHYREKKTASFGAITRNILLLNIEISYNFLVFILVQQEEIFKRV